MSVDEFGARLLGEVKEENLAELLASLRALHNPRASSQLNVPAIDRLLSIFQHPAPTFQPPAPLFSPSSKQAQLPKKEIKPKGAVIELTGRSPCSGKTALLYYITMFAILPAAHAGHALNGQDGAVVVLDTDGRFDVSRLRQVMKNYLKVMQGNKDESANLRDEAISDTLIAASLRHVHIFRPQSSASLLATIESLNTYLLSSTAHVSQNRRLAALLLDSASAFFRQDRMADDQLNAGVIEDDAGDTTGRKTFVQIWQSIVRALRAIQSTFDCPIVATNWAVFTASSSQHYSYSSFRPVPPIRPHLPEVWSSFCTLRIILQRNSVRQFAPEMSVSEAAMENNQRLEAVRRGGFSGSVDEWRSEEWSAEIRERLKAVEGRGSFWFWIREEGVGFEE